jgi:hypothetical protein
VRSGVRSGIGELSSSRLHDSLHDSRTSKALHNKRYHRQRDAARLTAILSHHRVNRAKQSGEEGGSGGVVLHVLDVSTPRPLQSR